MFSNLYLILFYAVRGSQMVPVQKSFYIIEYSAYRLTSFLLREISSRGQWPNRQCRRQSFETAKKKQK